MLVPPLLGLTLGVVFAWASAEELQRTSGAATSSRSLLLVALYGLLVHGPIAAYFVAYNPDWAYGFLVNTARLPSVVDSAVVLCAVAAPPVGFVVAARRAAERRIGLLLQLGAVPAALAAVVVLVAAPRLAVQATYTQYHGDFGVEPIAGSRLGLSLAWMAAVLAGAVGWTSFCLRRFAGNRRRG